MIVRTKKLRLFRTTAWLWAAVGVIYAAVGCDMGATLTGTAPLGTSKSAGQVIAVFILIIVAETVAKSHLS
jgi:hypothetical protein